MTRIVHLAIAFEPDDLVIASASRRTYLGVSKDGSYLHCVHPLPVDLVDANGTVIRRVGALTCNCSGGQFRGTCYRAANWTVLGMTLGLGKDATTKHPNRSLKQLLGFPLVKDFQRRLCAVA